MTKPYYDQLVRIFIQEIRSQFTQKKMSEKLGYRYNQWHKWESGQKKLMWTDLLKIAALLKINLDDAIKVITNDKGQGKSSGTLVKSIIHKTRTY